MGNFDCLFWFLPAQHGAAYNQGDFKHLGARRRLNIFAFVNENNRRRNCKQIQYKLLNYNSNSCKIICPRGGLVSSALLLPILFANTYIKGVSGKIPQSTDVFCVIYQEPCNGIKTFFCFQIIVQEMFVMHSSAFANILR